MSQMGPLLHPFHLLHLLSSRALSGTHRDAEGSDDPESILPPHVIVSPIQWGLDDQIAQAQAEDPARKSYIPSILRT